MATWLCKHSPTRPSLDVATLTSQPYSNQKTGWATAFSLENKLLVRTTRQVLIVKTPSSLFWHPPVMDGEGRVASSNQLLSQATSNPKPLDGKANPAGKMFESTFQRWSTSFFAEAARLKNFLAVLVGSACHTERLVVRRNFRMPLSMVQALNSTNSLETGLTNWGLRTSG